MSKGNPSTPAPDWEARHLPRGKAVLEWMGASPSSERSAIEGYFVETDAGGRSATATDETPSPHGERTPECLPDPEPVYEGPKPPTGWDDWNATLDGLVDRAEQLRKVAGERRHWATEKLASIRAGLRSGWRFAESFAARLHLSTVHEPRRREPITFGTKHSKH